MDMFAMFHCGRPDILPVGDLAVRKGFQTLYALPAPPSVEEMEALAEPWRPFRSLGRRVPARSRRRGCLSPATARLRGVGAPLRPRAACSTRPQYALACCSASPLSRPLYLLAGHCATTALCCPESSRLRCAPSKRVCTPRSYFMWKVPAGPKAPRTPKKAPKARRAGVAVKAEAAAAAEVGGVTAVAVAAAAAAVPT